MPCKDRARQNANQRAWYRRNKAKQLAWVAAQKAKVKAQVSELKNVPCMDCGVTYPPYVMDFDHRDPSQKRFMLSKSVYYGRLVVLAEAKKCDVVCSNCHRLRTHSRRVGSNPATETSEGRKTGAV